MTDVLHRLHEAAANPNYGECIRELAFDAAKAIEAPDLRAAQAMREAGDERTDPPGFALHWRKVSALHGNAIPAWVRTFARLTWLAALRWEGVDR